MAELAKYGTQTTFYFPLVTKDAADFITGATHASGDTKLIKDGGASANTTNGFTNEGNGFYSIVLTATEMQASRLCLSIIDQGTKAWEDQAVIIQTHGNASASLVFDLDQATPAVNATQISGDSTAADNLEATFDGTGYAIPGLIERIGTATAGASSTITLDGGASTTASLYRGMTVVIFGGTGAGQARNITAYSTGRVCTVTPAWTTNPDNTSLFAIVYDGSVDIAAWRNNQPNSLVSGAVPANVTLTGGVALASATAGYVPADVGRLQSVVTPLTNLVRTYNGYTTGNADSGTTTTLVDNALTQADDYWNGQFLLFRDGSNVGIARMITDFDAATDTITFSPAVPNAVTTEGYVIVPNGKDADIALINAKTTNLPSDPADASVIAGRFDTLDTSIADLPTNAELTTALGTADDAVLAQIALVKAKTDPLTYTVANQVDVNIQYVNDVEVTGNGETGTEWGPA
jgi:hypothetical protein